MARPATVSASNSVSIRANSVSCNLDQVYISSGLFRSGLFWLKLSACMLSLGRFLIGLFTIRPVYSISSVF